MIKRCINVYSHSELFCEEKKNYFCVFFICFFFLTYTWVKIIPPRKLFCFYRNVYCFHRDQCFCSREKNIQYGRCIVLYFDPIINSNTCKQFNDARRVHESVRLVVVAIFRFFWPRKYKKKILKLEKFKQCRVSLTK